MRRRRTGAMQSHARHARFSGSPGRLHHGAQSGSGL